MSAYLDYNATAPVRPEVVAVMQEVLASPANASSMHGYGRRAKKRLEDARKIIADAVSVFPNEVIFTATGSEANAMALRGIAGRRVLVSAVEHSSILPPPSRGEGLIPVSSDGLVDLETLEKMLAGGAPALVSIMLANNETGVIQPIAEVAAICKNHGALLHTDAVQALGKIPVDFGLLGCDMMTLSAHKCGGPVGAAALIVKQGLPIAPLFTGGGQELGRRAGTENIAAIAGFARAVELFDFSRMEKLRGWLKEMEEMLLPPPLRGRVGVGGDAHSDTSARSTPHPTLPLKGGGIIFGTSAPRLPNTSCIAMPGVSSEVQLMDFDLKGFAVSAGSACSSGRIEPSHVLAAMGAGETAKWAIRVSAGWNTTQDEIVAFTQAWKSTCERLATSSKY